MASSASSAAAVSSAAVSSAAVDTDSDDEDAAKKKNGSGGGGAAKALGMFSAKPGLAGKITGKVRWTGLKKGLFSVRSFRKQKMTAKEFLIGNKLEVGSNINLDV